MDGTVLADHPPAVPGAHDSVVLWRFLLGAAQRGGADARQLARDARLPAWALAAGNAMFPSRYFMRLWELIERALEDPHIPMTIASRYQVGYLELFDYLIGTAATVRAGLQANQDFLHLVTTDRRLRAEAQTDRDITYSYRHAEPGDRGEDLCNQFAMAVVCARARAATGSPVVPAHVAFTFPAPRSHRVLAETFGTAKIDFGAPTTTITLRSSDLDLPLRGSDPVLNRILRRYAANLPSPPALTWVEHFRRLVNEALDRGGPSLDGLARRMLVSRRTLQRQLAEHGTTWRAELDAARRRRAQDARLRGAADLARLARQLGYADPRSASRLLRRWHHQAP